MLAEVVLIYGELHCRLTERRWDRVGLRKEVHDGVRDRVVFSDGGYQKLSR